MMDILVKEPLHLKENSKLLAKIHKDMHQDSIDIQISVKEKLTYDINNAKDLTQTEKDKILAYLEKLPVGDKICHFDFHPGNIMMSSNKPIIIDWMTACSGNPCADVARTIVLLQFGEIEHVSFLKKLVVNLFKHYIGRVYLKEYLKITKIKKSDVKEWIVPIVAARLAEWLTEYERQNLLKYLRKELKSI